ncbi:MAG: hypothetical protein H7296_13135 [Bacteroidia bacterium]|nr:hypothetical protein [Bacteroidia bacterium]
MKIKKATPFLVFVFISFTITAQIKTDSLTIKNGTNSNKIAWGAGVNFSTNGIGVQLSGAITNNNKLIGRISGSYLQYEFKKIEYDVSGTKLSSNVKLTFGSVGGYLDWHPFGNAFKLTGGVAYLLTNMKGSAYVRDSVKQGEITLNTASVGNIQIGVDTRVIAPYMGIGFGRAVPKNRLGFGIEVGTYYIGPPRISFICTGLLEPTSDQEEVLKKNMQQYQWLPQLMININFRLTK